jgi:hypothetical protein
LPDRKEEPEGRPEREVSVELIGGVRPAQNVSLLETIIVRGGPGRHLATFGRIPPGVISRSSTVLANICEMGGDPPADPFIGDAAMEIRNIAPTDNNSVEVWAEISWHEPLNFRIQLVIFN